MECQFRIIFAFLSSLAILFGSSHAQDLPYGGAHGENICAAESIVCDYSSFFQANLHLKLEARDVPEGSISQPEETNKSFTLQTPKLSGGSQGKGRSHGRRRRQTQIDPGRSHAKGRSHGRRRRQKPKVSDHEAQVQPIPPRPKQMAQHDMSHRNIVLAWTPRAGCTFVMEMWLRFLGCYSAAVAYNPFLHGYSQDVLKGKPNGGHAKDKDLWGQGNFKFKVVMNPYHRAVTMFDHAMETTAFPLKNLSFIGFLKYLEHDNAQNTFYDNPTPQYALHFAPQVAFESNDSGLYDRVCQIEDIGPCISDVNLITGLNFSVPDTNFHSHRHHHFEGDVANMAYTDMENRGAVPLTSDFFIGESGQRAASMVRMLYKSDFLAYGYNIKADPRAIGHRLDGLYSNLRSRRLQ